MGRFPECWGDLKKNNTDDKKRKKEEKRKERTIVKIHFFSLLLRTVLFSGVNINWQPSNTVNCSMGPVLYVCLREVSAL